MRNKCPLAQTAAWLPLAADQILGILGMCTYLPSTCRSRQGGGGDVQHAAATVGAVVVQRLLAPTRTHLHIHTDTHSWKPVGKGRAHSHTTRLFCSDACEWAWTRMWCAAETLPPFRRVADSGWSRLSSPTTCLSVQWKPIGNARGRAVAERRAAASRSRTRSAAFQPAGENVLISRIFVIWPLAHGRWKAVTHLFGPVAVVPDQHIHALGSLGTASLTAPVDGSQGEKREPHRALLCKLRALGGTFVCLSRLFGGAPRSCQRSLGEQADALARPNQATEGGGSVVSVRHSLPHPVSLKGSLSRLVRRAGTSQREAPRASFDHTRPSRVSRAAHQPRAQPVSPDAKHPHGRSTRTTPELPDRGYHVDLSAKSPCKSRSALHRRGQV